MNSCFQRRKSKLYSRACSTSAFRRAGGNAPTFDSALFATAREYAELLLAGKASHRYTPLDVAERWLAPNLGYER